MTEADRYLQKDSREGAANLVASASVIRRPAFGFTLIGVEVSRFVSVDTRNMMKNSDLG